MSEKLAKSPKPKIFISYSRVDEKFVDELVEGLEYDGRFDVRLDRQSIVEGEDWKTRLGALIAEADTVVFVLSPHAAQSRMCLWEVDEAHRLSKRIIPVLAESLGDTPAPPRLGALNYVRFDGGRSFIRGLAALTRALSTDLDWIREHTRLLARAMEWEAAGRQPNRMLSGNDIALAKAWIANRPGDAPEPTDLHFAFIRASELEEESRLNAERTRLAEIAEAQRDRAAALSERELAITRLSRRTTIGVAASGTLTALAGGLAYWGVNAERRFKVERERAATAAQKALQDEIAKQALRIDIVGQLTAFPASEGQTVIDALPGTSSSPWSTSLTQSLADTQLSLFASLSRANQLVLHATDGKQRPFLSTDLNGDIYLWQMPTGRKVSALIVSVDVWGDMHLQAPKYDAELWKSLFAKTNIKFAHVHNPGRDEMASVLREIVVSSKENKEQLTAIAIENSLFLFIYIGAGIAIKGKKFIPLWPVKDDYHKELEITDPDIEKKYYTLVEQRSLAVSDILMQLRESYAASVVLLDTQFGEAWKETWSR